MITSGNDTVHYYITQTKPPMKCVSKSPQLSIELGMRIKPKLPKLPPANRQCSKFATN